MDAGSSFNASFLVPFDRNQLFKEVIKPDQPLGIDTARVNITVTKDGVPCNSISEGCIRVAEFTDGSGTTTSRLVRLEAGKTVVWEELESTITSMRMIGTETQRPLFTTKMTDAPRGTMIELRYDFHKVQLPGLFGSSVNKSSFPTHISDSLPEAVKTAWTSDMLARGYTKLTSEDAGLGGFEIAFTLQVPLRLAPHARCLAHDFDARPQCLVHVARVPQFKRMDVWKELAKYYSPLGASKGVSYARGQGTFGGDDNTLATGMIRKADFTSQDFKVRARRGGSVRKSSVPG